MSALTLKLIALVCMTLDHIGYAIPSLSILRIVGRLSFPIYVFLLTTGFRYTSNRGRYALRLGIFAVLSQVPYMLFFNTKTVMAPGYLGSGKLLLSLFTDGNMMVSLLIALLCLWVLEDCKDRGMLKYLSWIIVAWVFVLFWLGVIKTDYGPKCLMLALVFYYLKDHPVWMVLGSVLALFHPLMLSYLKQIVEAILGKPQTFALPKAWEVKQIFALNSLILIRSYNGKRGWSPQSYLGYKAMQLGFYAYYPLHILVLFFLIKL